MLVREKGAAFGVTTIVVACVITGIWLVYSCENLGFTNAKLKLKGEGKQTTTDLFISSRARMNLRTANNAGSIAAVHDHTERVTY